jgi:MFS family permease
MTGRAPDIATAAHRPRLRARVVVLSGVWIAALAFVLLGFVEALPGGLANAAIVGVTFPLVLSTVTVGAVLVNRLPRHIVGWLLLGGGLSIAVSIGAAALADYGLNEHPGSVPGAIWFAILSGATGGSFIGLLGGFVPLFFPTGRLPSPRWRAVVLIAIVPTASPVITNLFGPLSPWAGNYPASVTSPLALGGFGGSLVGFLGMLSGVLGAVALVCVVASLVVRYRRAQGVERAQLKWFAYVGLVVVPMLLVAIVTGGATSGPLAVFTNVAWATAIGSLTLLPITIGIAVLRYRLYEIDRIVSRTISWVILTVLVAAFFVTFILVFQAILAPLTRSNELAVAGSTLVAFGLFQPIRRRVQRLVDRRFNRNRYDAERTVAAFAGRLRDEVDLDHLRAEILATVAQTVEPVSISLWLRE